jgi:nucleoside-diphosphate-sugar epimerase
MMRALVTGASGFVGRHVVTALHRERFSVRALVKEPSDRCDWGLKVERYVGNLLDREAMRAAVRDVQLVLHCAAALPGRATTASEIHEVNEEGTRNLVDACLDGGRPRIVFISTDSVYGDANHCGADENTRVDPNYFTEGNYPRAKLNAEAIIMAAYRDAALPVSIVRPCLMYGPGCSSGNDILRAWAQKRVHLLVDGGAARLSLLFVKDAAAAILLAGTRAEAIGQIYNLSDGESYSRREILEALARITGTRKFYVSVSSRTAIVASRILGDARRVAFATNSHVIDSSKIRQDLGFIPRTPLQAGLRVIQPWLCGRDRDSEPHTHDNACCG